MISSHAVIPAKAGIQTWIPAFAGMTKKTGFAAAALVVFGLASSPVLAADVALASTDTYQAFIDGRFQDAAGDFQKAAARADGGVHLPTNLALLSRDQGDQNAALAAWVQASLMSGADGFVWNQRGWAYLSAERYKEAKKSFETAIRQAASTSQQSEANLGLALTAMIDSYPKRAIAPLHTALLQGPYILPAASYEMGLAQMGVKKYHEALAYLLQSADLDRFDLEALKALEALYEKIGEAAPAWRVLHWISSFDPNDAEIGTAIERVAALVAGNPAATLDLRRVSRPLLSPTAAAYPDKDLPIALRVALFSNDHTGAPATITRFYFMSNSNFSLIAVNGETVRDNGAAYDQWQVDFRPESGLVEVRDTEGNIQYTAREPFTLAAKSQKASILLKSAQFVEQNGFDPGDRELRGKIEIIPNPDGFKVVNIVPLQDYLYGVVGPALPVGSLLEAYRAQAVVSRTAALWFKDHHAPNLEKTDICDSDFCQKYLGVSGEMDKSAQAVLETARSILSEGGKPAQLPQHENCGGMTEDGIIDASAPVPAFKSPEDLERWLHEAPPQGVFCQASGLTPPAEARWIRILDARDLKKRADKISYVGSLKHIEVLRRAATGRVTALMVVGTRGTFDLLGAQAIGNFLSPGSLRSTLFSVTPLMDGSTAQYFILWGAGTGEGLGLCRAGLIGRAAAGQDYKAILSAYFPKLALENSQAQKEVKPSTTVSAQSSQPAKSGKKLPKNPHWKGE